MVSREGGDNMLPLLCINSRTVPQNDHIYPPVHDDVPSITMLISLSGHKLNANILFDFLWLFRQSWLGLLLLVATKHITFIF